jgi:hypothetical protein
MHCELLADESMHSRVAVALHLHGSSFDALAVDAPRDAPIECCVLFAEW